MAATFASFRVFGSLGSGRIELSLCFFFAKLLNASFERMGMVWVVLRCPMGVRSVCFGGGRSLKMKTGF